MTQKNNTARLALTDREWREFKISDVFKVSGTITTHPSKLIPSGTTPRITCAATNNGLDATYANTPTEQGDVLTVDSATVGFISYQIKDFIATDHVEKIQRIDGKPMGHRIGLFIKGCIDNSVNGKYGYGYKFAQTRIKRQIITLPVLATDTTQPDWAFMEAYMRQTEQEILKPTIERLCKQLINNELLGGGGQTLCNNWQAFVFGEHFTIEATKSGIDKNKLTTAEGNTPYITRTDTTNGIGDFVGTQRENYHKDRGNVITIGLDTQTVFYQPTPFYTGQNIQVISHPKLNRHNAQFLIVAIKKLVEKFSWGSYGATLTRLRKSSLYLPATPDGEIDFCFMTRFMQEMESDLLNTTLRYFRNLATDDINQGGGGVKQWKIFEFTELFEICKGFYNKKPPCPADGRTPFIGATDSGNGITGYTTHALIRQHSKTGNPPNEPFERKLFHGGAICVTNNGSVGYAYYQQSEFTCTHDVNPLYLKNRTMTRHIGLFLCRAIEQQRVCFAYARKWRPKRMIRSRLKLPALQDGTPDWEYMEQYMRRVESRQIVEYLTRLADLQKQI